MPHGVVSIMKCSVSKAKQGKAKKQRNEVSPINPYVHNSNREQQEPNNKNNKHMMIVFVVVVAALCWAAGSTAMLTVCSVYFWLYSVLWVQEYMHTHTHMYKHIEMVCIFSDLSFFSVYLTITSMKRPKGLIYLLYRKEKSRLIIRVPLKTQTTTTIAFDTFILSYSQANQLCIFCSVYICLSG